MVTIECPKNELNLGVIADSGQCFRMEKLGAEVYRINKYNTFVDVAQTDDSLTFYCSDYEYGVEWKKYLDIDGVYDISGIIDDSFLQTAYKYGKGMRILKQDFWETLVSFIISQNNNIPRIKKCLGNLVSAYGGFPSASDILKNPEKVVGIGVGYRDVYLIDAAHHYIELKSSVVDKHVSYDDYIKELKKVKGVGDKVANCVALFSGHYLGACPVDVWMKRIIDEEYGGIKPSWMNSEMAGYYQQLAFYYKRNNS